MMPHDWSTDSEESSSVSSVCSSEGAASILASVAIPPDSLQDRGIDVPSEISGDVPGNNSKTEFIECPSKENVLGRLLLGGSDYGNEYSESSDEEWLRALLAPRAEATGMMICTSSSQDSDDSEMSDKGGPKRAKTYHETSDEEWLHALLAPRVTIGFKRPSTFVSLSSSGHDTDESELSLYETSDGNETERKLPHEKTDEEWLHALLAPRATAGSIKHCTVISMSGGNNSVKSDWSLYEASDRDAAESDKDEIDTMDDKCTECKTPGTVILDTSVHSEKTVLSLFVTSDEGPMDTCTDSSDTSAPHNLDKDDTSSTMDEGSECCDEINHVDLEGISTKAISSNASQEESYNTDSCVQSLVVSERSDAMVCNSDQSLADTLSEDQFSASPDLSSDSCGCSELNKLILDEKDAGSTKFTELILDEKDAESTEIQSNGSSRDDSLISVSGMPLAIGVPFLASASEDCSSSRSERCDFAPLDKMIPDLVEPGVPVTEDTESIKIECSQSCLSSPGPELGVLITDDSESMIDERSTCSTSTDLLHASVSVMDDTGSIINGSSETCLTSSDPTDTEPAGPITEDAELTTDECSETCSTAPDLLEPDISVAEDSESVMDDGSDACDSSCREGSEDGGTCPLGIETSQEESPDDAPDFDSYCDLEEGAGSLLEVDDPASPDTCMYIHTAPDGVVEDDEISTTDGSIESHAVSYDDDMECNKLKGPAAELHGSSKVIEPATSKAQTAKFKFVNGRTKVISICVLAVMAVAVAITVALVLSSSTTTGLCGVDLDVETGVFYMTLSGLSRLAKDTEVYHIEQLLEEAYSSVSAGCNDVFKRFPEKVSLVKQDLVTGFGGETLLDMSWSLDVKCDHCPPKEPLFSNRTSTQQEVVERDGTPQNESSSTKVRYLLSKPSHLRRSLQNPREEPSAVADGTVSIEPKKFFRKCEELIKRSRYDGLIESTFQSIADGGVLDSEGNQVFVLNPGSVATPTDAPVATAAPSATVTDAPTDGIGPSPAPSAKPVLSSAPTPMPSLVSTPSDTEAPLPFVTIRSAALYGTLCIEVPDSDVSENVALILGECNDGENQLWHMDDNGWIHSYLDYDKCMHVQMEEAVVPNGAIIEIAKCQDGSTDAEKWIWNSDGQIQLMSNPSQCIDGNFEGDIIYSWDCSLSKDQIWL